jgi:hypothetical protein
VQATARRARRHRAVPRHGRSWRGRASHAGRRARHHPSGGRRAGFRHARTHRRRRPGRAARRARPITPRPSACRPCATAIARLLRRTLWRRRRARPGLPSRRGHPARLLLVNGGPCSIRARKSCSPIPAIPATGISPGSSRRSAVGVPVGPESAYPAHRRIWSPGIGDEQTRGVLVANPGNPTGTLIPAGRTCAPSTLKCVKRKGGWLIVDEIYHELVYGSPTSRAPPALGEDVIVINSFSKYFLMTGWRLGWLLAPPDIAAGASTNWRRTCSSRRRRRRNTLRWRPSATPLGRYWRRARRNCVSAGMRCCRNWRIWGWGSRSSRPGRSTSMRIFQDLPRTPRRLPPVCWRHRGWQSPRGGISVDIAPIIMCASPILPRWRAFARRRSVWRSLCTFVAAHKKTGPKAGFF